MHYLSPELGLGKLIFLDTEKTMSETDIIFKRLWTFYYTTYNQNDK